MDRREFYAQRSMQRQRASYRAYALLRFAIKIGAIPAGHNLNERDLMSSLQTSRSAIRNALNQLSSDDLVVRQVAFGTVVTGDPISIGMFDFASADENRTVTYRHVDKVVIKSSEVLAARLGPDTEQVVMTESEILSGSEIVGIHTAFSASGGASGLTLHGRLETGAAWAEKFPSEYGVPFGHADVSIDARTADLEIAQRLDIKPGEAILLREEILYDRDGIVREYGYAQFRSDMVVLRTTTHDPDTPG